jgi:ferredoxin-NADP reductase
MSSNAINKGFHAARIVQKRMLSPTVCWIHLDVSQQVEPPFKSTSRSSLTFEPCQWLDFVVPGLPWVGGFSLVSDPAELPVLSLAVRLGLRPTQSSSKQQQKQAQAPLPSTWVHDDSRVGSNVEIRVGGTCTLQPEHQKGRPVVFCAGGIGIVTMLSLYRAHYHNDHYLRRLDTSTLPDTYRPSPTTLFYSASTQEEMVFADELIDLVSTYGTQARGDRLVLALTQQAAWKHITTSTSASTSNAGQQERALVDSTSEKEEGLIEYRTGRELRNFLSEQADDSVYYLCGPPAMIDEAVRILVEDRGVPETDIIYEKWW